MGKHSVSWCNKNIYKHDKKPRISNYIKTKSKLNKKNQYTRATRDQMGKGGKQLKLDTVAFVQL